MIRTPAVSAALTAVVALAAGCEGECPNPQFLLSGKTFRVFSSVQSANPSSLPAEFPAEWNPADGVHEWQLEWASAALDSDLTWTMDGQSFPGHGAFDDELCGRVTLRAEGTYYADPAELEGPRFKFLQTGSFETWTDAAGTPHLEGTGHFEAYWYRGGLNSLVEFETQVVTALPGVD